MNRNGKAPQASAIAPQASAIAPQAPAIAPQAPAIAPQAPAIAPQAPAIAPQAPAIAPQASGRRASNYQSNFSVARRLVAAQVLLEKVLTSPDLQGKLAPYGYNLDTILQGMQLFERATALNQQQLARVGEQRAARLARDAAQARAHATYMRQVALARVALRDDPGAAKMIGVDAARKRQVAGWIVQAQQFYANSIGEPAVLAKLATRGLTREQLAQGQDLVGIVATNLACHDQRQDTRQATTRARDEAMRALDRWMQDFMATARVVLDEQG